MYKHVHAHKARATNTALITLWRFFSPDVLVIPGSGDTMESLGTGDAPQSGWRRMEDVPGGGRKDHVSVLTGE